VSKHRATPPPERATLRDGAALSISAVLTGVVGLLCWVLAARTLPQAKVGAASAFVSGFILVAGIAQLNAGLGMLRWLPRAGRRSGALILRAYAVVGGTAAVAAAVFLVLPSGAIARELGPALFVVASVSWALFQLQDPVLAALGRAWWVPMFNGTYGIVRVVALPALGAAFGALGVLLSWVAPTVATLLAASVVMVVLVARRNRTAVPGELPPRREVLTFLGPTYVATLGTTVLYNSVPLLVTHDYGTVLGATFFVIWTGANAVDYGVSGFVNSLVLRGSSDPNALGAIVRGLARRLATLVLPGVAVGILAAPVLLGLFGPGYSGQGALALRIVLLGLAARVVVAVAVGIRQAQGDGRGAAVIQGASTIGVLTGVLLVPSGLGLAGPALGYLAAQSIVAGVVLPGLFRRYGHAPAAPPAPVPVRRRARTPYRRGQHRTTRAGTPAARATTTPHHRQLLPSSVVDATTEFDAVRPPAVPMTPLPIDATAPLDRVRPGEHP
jgi:O-antigen/teichoic acid export membrane protein